MIDWSIRQLFQFLMKWFNLLTLGLTSLLFFENCTFYKAFSFYKFEHRANELSQGLIDLAEKEKSFNSIAGIQKAVKSFENQFQVHIEQYYVFDFAHNLKYKRVLAPYARLDLQNDRLRKERETILKSTTVFHRYYNFLPAYVDVFLKTYQPLKGYLLVRFYQDEISNYEPKTENQKSFMDFYYGQFKKLQLKERLQKEYEERRKKLNL